MPELLPILAASDLNLWELIAKAHWVVKAVMVLLVLMSISSWYIIGYKYLFIRRATSESALFLDSFWRARDIEQIYKHAKTLQKSPISSMFLAGYTELARLTSDVRPDRDREADLENVERSLHRAQLTETTKLETIVPFLATTGSSAPFIGLFGTVWGIMTSFQAIAASKNTNLAVVAPGIAEALLATALGLLAAIPAVMFYNKFASQVTRLTIRLEGFADEFAAILSRQIDERSAA